MSAPKCSSPGCVRRCHCKGTRNGVKRFAKCCLKHKREISHLRHPSFNVFATLVSVAAVALSLAAASGAQSLPEPTESYPVGRITFHLVDDKREFTVQAWYPSQSGAEGKPASWVPADRLSHEEKGFVGM